MNVANAHADAQVRYDLETFAFGVVLFSSFEQGAHCIVC